MIDDGTICLPQEDGDSDARSAALHDQRAQYQYDFDFHDIGFAKSVPKSQALSARWTARVAELTAVLEANQLASYPKEWRDKGKGGLRTEARAVLHGLRRKMMDLTYGVPRDPTIHPWQSRVPESIAAYRDLYTLIEPPELVHRWQEDRAFAWQRIAGHLPTKIQLANATTLAKIPCDPQRYAALFGETLAEALQDSRLFVVDLHELAGIPAGINEGYPKYLNAPITLLRVPAGRRKPLMPVCIQVDQTHSTTNLFYPDDGVAWSMAKATFQVADSNLHGVQEHLGRCHIRALQIEIAAYRSFAPNHPWLVLLTHHFQETLAVVNELTQPLLQADGKTPHLQSVTQQGALQILHNLFNAGEWNDAFPDLDFAARGVLDRDILPVYPYRDDALLSWDALGSFTESYIHLYYGSDHDVAQDKELQHFVHLLTARHGCRLQPGQVGIAGLVNSKAAAARLLRQIIYLVTTYHNAINYTVFECMGFAPNMPTAAYAPAPSSKDTYDEGDLRAIFPPLSIARATIADVYVVSNLRINRLGKYPEGSFPDRRVWPLVARLQGRLEDADHKIAHRNQHRYMAYPFLMPKHTAASIQV